MNTLPSWQTPDLPASKYIVAHIKKCNLCRKHDRHVGSGESYTSKEMARFKAHIAATLARIKLAIEDEKVGVVREKL